MRAATGTLLFPLAALVLLPACATKRYEVSTFRAVPPAAGHSDGRRARLQLSGLEVVVEGDDVVAPAAAPAPLVVRLRLRSKQIGYAFDPTRVVLRRGAEEWRARSQGPFGEDCERVQVAPDAGEGRVWLQRASCFVLSFDVATGDNARLVLSGLARGRTPIAPVAMPVERRRVQERYLTPTGVEVLTFPLKLLLLPFAYAAAI